MPAAGGPRPSDRQRRTTRREIGRFGRRQRDDRNAPHYCSQVERSSGGTRTVSFEFAGMPSAVVVTPVGLVPVEHTPVGAVHGGRFVLGQGPAERGSGVSSVVRWCHQPDCLELGEPPQLVGDNPDSADALVTDGEHVYAQDLEGSSGRSDRAQRCAQ